VYLPRVSYSRILGCELVAQVRCTATGGELGNLVAHPRSIGNLESCIIIEECVSCN
jgi:hypothetical protein